MRVITFLVLGMVAVLPRAASPAEILMLTPFGSRSVCALFSVLTEGLTARGHQVTLLASGTAPGDAVYHNHNVTLLKAPKSGINQMDLFEIRRNGGVFHTLLKALPQVARALYSDPKVMEVWHRRHRYDAIIINSAVNEMAFPFLLEVTAPFITFSPTGTEPLQLSYLGNMVSPAALPSVVLPYHDSLTLWERLVNTLATVALRYFFRRNVAAPLTKALRETFPEMPDPATLYPLQALSLLNRHHLLDGALPLLPNQVEIGCLTCRPARALPQDLQRWLDESDEGGVVYFSLGSIQQTTSLPAHYTQALFQAFSALPTRVLAKFSSPPLPLPPHVRVEEWLPQQDILAHPKVKLFVTHCGKNSAGEGVYHGVPMLGLPITMDHPRTCARLARRGEATVLQWEDLTPQALVTAITTMLNDTRFKDRVEGVSRRMKAQRESGLEKAVWWIEYAMEHGDRFLRFSGADLSLAQYLLLDVLLILLVAACITSLPACFLLWCLYRRCKAFHKTKAKAE